MERHQNGVNKFSFYELELHFLSFMVMLSRFKRTFLEILYVCNNLNEVTKWILEVRLYGIVNFYTIKALH